MDAFIRNVLVCASLLVAVSACGQGSSGDEVAGGPGSEATVPVAGFVNRQIAATADDTDPVDVNSIEFIFPNERNDNAFENLLR